MTVSLTRRHFLSLSAAAILAPAKGVSATAHSRIHVIDMANAPFLDRDTVPDTLDAANACSQPNHRFLEKLTSSGVDTVLRYFSDQNNAGLNCKNVTRRERDLLHDHGLALAIVYQFEGRGRNRYTGARASADALFCLDRARIIGQPEGSAIYFGVDSDVGLNTDQGVLDYFRTVRAVFDGRFKIGIYAAGARCDLIRSAELADYFWVPEAPAWAGTRAFMNSGEWTMYQNKTNIDKSGLTRDLGQVLHIDTDIVNPLWGDSIGAFKRDGSEMRYAPGRLTMIAAARMWVTADRLDVFDTPNGAVVDHICIARTVHVLNMTGDWALVDTDEDGIADGYCRHAGLAPLSEMPQWRPGTCKVNDI